MRVFLTGGSGNIGTAVVHELIGAGHTVIALARSDEAASIVERLGAEAYRGDLDDLDGLAAAAADADGVIHLAFKHDLQEAGNLAAAAAADLRAIGVIGQALAGSGKPFVGTNATGAFALAGFSGVLTERDELPGGPRIEAENLVIGFSGHKVRSSVVRLPPTVHGANAYGFASGLIEIARATGTSYWVGTGTNRWPSVGTTDAARVFRLAVESAPAGTRLHAVAEEGVTLRDIATVIGRRLRLPAASLPDDQTDGHFGPLAMFVRLDNPTSSGVTRNALGWTPQHTGLIDELAEDRTSIEP